MFLTGTTISFLSWAGFYAANPARISNKYLERVPARPLFMRGLGILLGILALYPFAKTLGLERGITAWIGVLTLSGVIYAFSIQSHPKLNRAVVYISITLGLVGLILTVMGGM